jgi:hypothetical protein
VQTDLAVPRKFRNHSKMIIDGFAIYANSSAYIGHRWTCFEKQNLYMALKQWNQKACIKFSINRIFDIKSISIMNNKLQIRCPTSYAAFQESFLAKGLDENIG